MEAQHDGSRARRCWLGLLALGFAAAGFWRGSVPKEWGASRGLPADSGMLPSMLASPGNLSETTGIRQEVANSSRQQAAESPGLGALPRPSQASQLPEEWNASRGLPSDSGTLPSTSASAGNLRETTAIRQEAANSTRQQVAKSPLPDAPPQPNQASQLPKESNASRGLPAASGMLPSTLASAGNLSETTTIREEVANSTRQQAVMSPLLDALPRPNQESNASRGPPADSGMLHSTLASAGTLSGTATIREEAANSTRQQAANSTRANQEEEEEEQLAPAKGQPAAASTSASSSSSQAAGDGVVTVVVARVQKDSRKWLEKLGRDVPHVLYTEGGVDSDPSGIEFRKPLARKGSSTRECGGYLTYLVENYDRLPQVVVFMQGQPLGKPSMEKENTDYHTDHFFIQSIRHILRAPEKVGYCSLNIAYSDWREQKKSPFYIAEFLQALQEGMAKEPARWEILGRVLLPLLPPQGTRCYCCAQFAVARRRILRHPKAFYESLLDFIEEEEPNTRQGPATNVRCSYLERMWHIMFGADADCPEQGSQCRAIYEGPSALKRLIHMGHR